MHFTWNRNGSIGIGLCHREPYCAAGAFQHKKAFVTATELKPVRPLPKTVFKVSLPMHGPWHERIDFLPASNVNFRNRFSVSFKSFS
jgi:hypothetical protein